MIGLSPHLLAVGGDVVSIGDHYVTGLRESLSQRTPPALSSRLRFAAAEDVSRAAILGGVELALDHLLSSA